MISLSLPLTLLLLRYLRLIFQLVQGDVDGSVDGSDAGSVASGGRRTGDPRPVLLGVDNPLEVGFSRGTGLEGRRAQGRHVSAPRAARCPQVWSLTQFYSVDFSRSRIGVKKCVFNKRTIKVRVSCFLRCPGTFVPSAAHLTVSLYFCSSGSNTRGEARAREGCHVSSKSPSRV